MSFDYIVPSLTSVTVNTIHSFVLILFGFIELFVKYVIRR